MLLPKRLLRYLTIGVGAVSLGTYGASPAIMSVSTVQNSETRALTVSYTLANAPAIVTIDIVTNGSASVGGAALRGLTGDVNKVIADDGSYSAEWPADVACPEGTVARAVVTAWPLDNPPDYMAVDLTRAVSGVVRYYASLEELPTMNGPTDNVYRTTQMLCRRIRAKGVAWDMGPNGSDKHAVTLDHDYYMGIFEVTQKQWYLVNAVKSWPSGFTFYGDVIGRPVEKVAYADIRGTSYWPDAPTSGTFLYKLREKTDVAFDLPGEAEWEYAARAGHANGFWGDGSQVLTTASSGTDANLLKLARYQSNGKPKNASGAYYDPPLTVDASLGSAIVGSYKPNGYGLYDMAGNMWESCLDGYDNIVRPVKNLDGDIYTGSTTSLVVRGGCYLNGPNLQVFTARSYTSPTSTSNARGFRVVVRLAAVESPVSVSSDPFALDASGFGTFVAAGLDARGQSHATTAAIFLNSYPCIGTYVILR